MVMMLAILCDSFVAVSCRGECSYHGHCVSMERHARNVQNTIQLASYTKVWDHDKIHGCECDVGFEGYDCSLRQCPRGDDPMTSNQVTEIQLLYCKATAGYFTLSMDGKTSLNIDFNANTGALRDAIQVRRCTRRDGWLYT